MLKEARAGLADIVPAAVAAAPFGLLFGALAAGKGLSPLEVLAMSLFVFAGGAQFAAIEIWTLPAPVFALVFSTLLINSRHVLMSASIVPKLDGLGTFQKLAGLYFMADENWAMAEKRARTHTLTPAYWFGMIALLIPTWLTMTTLGALIGPALGDPRRFGADFAFTAIFIALVASLWKGRVTAWTVAAAGIGSAVTYKLAGPPWHVLAGAICGLAAAWWAAAPAVALQLGEERP
jgi:4-azaleucine resistance transporter AzlC